MSTLNSSLLKKRKVLYKLEEDLAAKIATLPLADDKKQLILTLCVESAKEGIEKFSGA